MPWFESRYPSHFCGSSSVVEHHLAKVGVASSNLVFRSIIYFIMRWRHSQVVRHRSATPLSPVQIRLPPPFFFISKTLHIIMPVWRNWQTRTTQNRVPFGVSVRPRPPVSYKRLLDSSSLFFIILLH